jgi:hypothetical protein
MGTNVGTGESGFHAPEKPPAAGFVDPEPRSWLRPQCGRPTVGGGRCESPVLTANGACVKHDPAVPREDLAAWVSMGGSATLRVWPKSALPEPPNLSSRKSAVALLGRIVAAVLCGELGKGEARVAILGIEAARGWYADDLAARLREVEQAFDQIAQRPPGMRVLSP